MSELVWQVLRIGDHVLRGVRIGWTRRLRLWWEMRDVVPSTDPTGHAETQALSCSAQMQPTTHSDHASNVPLDASHSGALPRAEVRVRSVRSPNSSLMVPVRFTGY